MSEDVRTWIATHVGLVRPNNEDRCRTSGWWESSQDGRWDGTTDRAGGWALVADGMGGHGAGEVASDLAVRSLAEFLPSTRSRESLENAIERTNDRMHEAMFSAGGRPGMGTTVVGVLLRGPTCTFFNVGDSRAYLLRNGELQRQSRDHTPEGGGGRTTMRRSHALTQSLGGTIAKLKLKPHLAEVTLLPGDVVLLCSDGLTDLVPDDIIADQLGRASRQPAADLVDAALAAGGRDNVTVIVLAF